MLFAKWEQKLKISPHIGNLVWHMWVSVDQASCLYHLSQILFWKGENATKIGLTMLWWRQWIAREEPRCQRRKVAVKRDGRRGQLVLVKRDGGRGVQLVVFGKISSQEIYRSQPLFYFVPHSQAGSTRSQGRRKWAPSLSQVWEATSCIWCTRFHLRVGKWGQSYYSCNFSLAKHCTSDGL